MGSWFVIEGLWVGVSVRNGGLVLCLCFVLVFFIVVLEKGVIGGYEVLVVCFEILSCLYFKLENIYELWL